MRRIVGPAILPPRTNDRVSYSYADPEGGGGGRGPGSP